MVGPVPREPVLVGVAEELRARILHGPDFLLVRVDLATATAVVSPQVGISVAAGPRIGWGGMSEACQRTANTVRSAPLSG